MLRVLTPSLSACFRGVWAGSLSSARPCSTLPPGGAENQLTVDALYDLSVDIRKVRKLKGWVLLQRTAYVRETAGLLRDLGADGPAIARVLEQHPEAVLCRPEEVRAQRELWASVCPNNRDLVGIIEKFPASFFTVTHQASQKANIEYFQSLKLNKRIVSKLLASAPQSFCRPVEENQEAVRALTEAYLSLGGEEGNLRIWLQKLLSQNPFALLKPPARSGTTWPSSGPGASVPPSCSSSSPSSRASSRSSARPAWGTPWPTRRARWGVRTES
ncbi:hypothetical protein COCON_G00231780 [Conger conger]|uniref:Mitochondrial transcription termination factor 2 n=1 Tax=Conger conger TaxID=82655 RepID=A0A9Q1HMB3_CONCO|nr:hypothetical protein COCON_G00231780 [Conger conger]